MKRLFNWLSEDVVCVRPRGIAILERVVIWLAIYHTYLRVLIWIFE